MVIKLALVADVVAVTTAVLAVVGLAVDCFVTWAAAVGAEALRALGLLVVLLATVPASSASIQTSVHDENLV